MDKLVVVFDETPAGVSEVTCVIDAGATQVGLKLRGITYREGLSKFLAMPSGKGILIFYCGMGVVVDHAKGGFAFNKLNIYPCIEALTAESGVVVRSFSKVCIVRAVDNISYIEYGGEIEGIQLIDPQTVILDVNDPGWGREKVNLVV